MPIRVPEGLPAIDVLRREQIFVMGEIRARTQDIRPLRILIVNLMPRKMVTEEQLLRLLSNTPLQVEIDFLHTETYAATHTDADYLDTFYKTFPHIASSRYDGMIITGAPVERLAFEEVVYWKELTTILEWAKTHVFSTLYICWAAQAGLYHHYGIRKAPLSSKLFGVYPQRIRAPFHPLLRGLDEGFPMPHSRHTEIDAEAVEAHKKLLIVADAPEAGLGIVTDIEGRHVFVFGHPEYDADTLHYEYERDRALGEDVVLPVGYYPNDDPTQPPRRTWHATGSLLYANWLNYLVYQETPYTWTEQAP